MLDEESDGTDMRQAIASDDILSVSNIDISAFIEINFCF